MSVLFSRSAKFPKVPAFMSPCPRRLRSKLPIDLIKMKAHDILRPRPFLIIYNLTSLDNAAKIDRTQRQSLHASVSNFYYDNTRN